MIKRMQRREPDGGAMPRSVRRIAAAAAVVALAISPALSANAATVVAADRGKAGAPTFYANGSHDRLLRVILQGKKATSKTLVTAASPVWWRSFYLTPSSAAGDWVVGALSGDQRDTTDPPRLFEYNTAAKSLKWLKPRSWAYRAPVVDTEKVPKVFYIAGNTVREISTAVAHDHLVFSAPHGWKISALTVAGTAEPYVALTHNTGATVATATTDVVQLTSTPTPVLPQTTGTVSALALSPDTSTLAISRIKTDGDSVLTLQAMSHDGVAKTLPDVGETSQLSWDSAGDTLAVDPQQWGGWTLVTILTGETAYPKAMQPYGGGIFAPVPTGKDGSKG
jgi:hypothetical protein